MSQALPPLPHESKPSPLRSGLSSNAQSPQSNNPYNQPSNTVHGHDALSAEPKVSNADPSDSANEDKVLLSERLSVDQAVGVSRPTEQISTVKPGDGANEAEELYLSNSTPSSSKDQDRGELLRGQKEHLHDQTSQREDSVPSRQPSNLEEIVSERQSNQRNSQEVTQPNIATSHGSTREGSKVAEHVHRSQEIMAAYNDEKIPVEENESYGPRGFTMWDNLAARPYDVQNSAQAPTTSFKPNFSTSSSTDREARNPVRSEETNLPIPVLQPEEMSRNLTIPFEPNVNSQRRSITDTSARTSSEARSRQHSEHSFVSAMSTREQLTSDINDHPVPAVPKGSTIAIHASEYKPRKEHRRQPTLPDIGVIGQPNDPQDFTQGPDRKANSDQLHHSRAASQPATSLAGLSGYASPQPPRIEHHSNVQINNEPSAIDDTPVHPAEDSAKPLALQKSRNRLSRRNNTAIDSKDTESTPQKTDEKPTKKRSSLFGSLISRSHTPRVEQKDKITSRPSKLVKNNRRKSGNLLSQEQPPALPPPHMIGEFHEPTAMTSAPASQFTDAKQVAKEESMQRTQPSMDNTIGKGSLDDYFAHGVTPAFETPPPVEDQPPLPPLPRKSSHHARHVSYLQSQNIFPARQPTQHASRQHRRAETVDTLQTSRYGPPPRTLSDEASMYTSRPDQRALQHHPSNASSVYSARPDHAAAQFRSGNVPSQNIMQQEIDNMTPQGLTWSQAGPSAQDYRQYTSAPYSHDLMESHGNVASGQYGYYPEGHEYRQNEPRRQTMPPQQSSYEYYGYGREGAAGRQTGRLQTYANSRAPSSGRFYQGGFGS